MVSDQHLRVLVIVGQGGITVVIERERLGGGNGYPTVLEYLLGSVDSFSK
jgi:hypothetical protein